VQKRAKILKKIKTKLLKKNKLKTKNGGFKTPKKNRAVNNIKIENFLFLKTTSKTEFSNFSKFLFLFN